jgi:hypothetical protein
MTASLWEATYIGMVFTNQKNGVQEEVMGLHATTNPEACPMQAAVQHNTLPMHLHHVPPKLYSVHTMICSPTCSLVPH